MAKKKETEALTVVAEVVNDVVVVERKTTAQQYLDDAIAFTVTSADDYASAANKTTAIKGVVDKMEDEKNKVLLPAKAIVKAETARWKPIEDILAKADAIYRSKMLVWHKADLEKAKNDLAKLNQKVANGVISRPETIQRKESEIYASVPDKTVHTGSATATVKQIPDMEIVDIKLIPDEYWVIDEKKLRKAVVGDKLTVPGAKLIYKDSLAII